MGHESHKYTLWFSYPNNDSKSRTRRDSKSSTMDIDVSGDETMNLLERLLNTVMEGTRLLCSFPLQTFGGDIILINNKFEKVPGFLQDTRDPWSLLLTTGKVQRTSGTSKETPLC